jgi:hypothetical protein
VFRTLADPTRDMKREAAAAGTVEIPFAHRPAGKIQINTIAEPLGGMHSDLPGLGRRGRLPGQRPRHGRQDGTVRLSGRARRSWDREFEGKRLSCGSSGLPRTSVPEDGVEDGEEFASDGDEGDHPWLSGGEKLVAEGAQGGVMAARDHGSDEQGGAHGGPPAGANGPLPIGPVAAAFL